MTSSTKDSLETHIATAVAVLSAALAIVHPGFKLPPDTVQIVAPILLGGAVVLQWIHKWQKAPKGQKVAVVESAAKSVVTAVEDGTAEKDVSIVKTTVGEVRVGVSDATEVKAELAPTPAPDPTLPPTA